MDDFQGRRRWRTWFYSRGSAIILILIALFLAQALWRAYGQSQNVVGERQTASHELAELTAREDYLETQVAGLETDRGVEAEIRKKFPVVKPGEKVIVVVPEPSATPTATSTPPGWWAKFLASVGLNKRD